MSEIEKLYENAGIVPDCEHGECGLNYCPNNYGCGYAFYPPFTAEKQLEIVKFLLNKSVYYDTYGDREYWFHLSDEIENSKYRDFDEAIAECINNMWNDLRDYEKVRLSEILK